VKKIDHADQSRQHDSTAKSDWVWPLETACHAAQSTMGDEWSLSAQHAGHARRPSAKCIQLHCLHALMTGTIAAALQWVYI
jgi:hypothetical protein